MSMRFVGRERQLTVAREQLLDARAGRPEPMLITGESGVGKSMFLDRLADTARDDGFRVFRLDGDIARPRRPPSGADGRRRAVGRRIAPTPPRRGSRCRSRRVGDDDAPPCRPATRRRRCPPAVPRGRVDTHAGAAGDRRSAPGRRRHRGRCVVPHAPPPPPTGARRRDLADRHRRRDHVVRATSNGRWPPANSFQSPSGRSTTTSSRRSCELVPAGAPTATFVDALRARTGGMPFFAAELVDAMAAHPASGPGELTGSSSPCRDGWPPRSCTGCSRSAPTPGSWRRSSPCSAGSASIDCRRSPRSRR